MPDNEEIQLAPQDGYAFRSAGEMVFRAEQTNGSEGILEGRMVPYNEWAKVDSYIEGRFYERFLPRSFAKNIQERGDRIRVLFEHGMSKLLDNQPIAKLEELEERDDGLHYRATPPAGPARSVRGGLAGRPLRVVCQAQACEAVGSPIPAAVGSQPGRVGGTLRQRGTDQRVQCGHVPRLRLGDRKHPFAHRQLRGPPSVGASATAARTPKIADRGRAAPLRACPRGSPSGGNGEPGHSAGRNHRAASPAKGLVGTD